MSEEKSDCRMLEIFQRGGELLRYSIDEVSLIMPDGVDFHTVEGMVFKMKGISDSIRFWLGDLVVYSERNHKELHSQLLDEMDYSKQSISDMMWVSKRVAASVRRKELTWSHHREVAKLPMEEQRRFLDIAVREKLSVLALREMIKPKPLHKESKVESFENALLAIVKKIKSSDYFDDDMFDKKEMVAEPVGITKFCTEIAMIARDVIVAFE